MAKEFPQPERVRRDLRGAVPADLPLPTQRVRHRAWLAFQRAPDPLASPKPLPAVAVRSRPASRR